MNYEFAQSVEDLNALKWDDLPSLYVSHLGSAVLADDTPKENRDAMRVAFYACVLASNLRHAADRGEFLMNLRDDDAFKSLMDAASRAKI